jgi:hypothetical protein
MNDVMETKLRLNLIFFGLEFNITRVLHELRTLLKFNIFFLPAIAACYAATGYVVWNRLSANAEQDVMETARLMLETAQAMRTYTTTQVAPLLGQERAKAERSVQNMEQVLDVQMPAAVQKAMPRLPAAKEQRILRTTRHSLPTACIRNKMTSPNRNSFPNQFRSTRRRKRSTISGGNFPISCTRRRP